MGISTTVNGNTIGNTAQVSRLAIIQGSMLA